MRLDLWHFVTSGGESVILKWVRKERLSRRDKARLNQKLDRLRDVDFELACNTKLLAGPIHEHIYKLRVFGDVMMRPLLCRGPVFNEREYTPLLGAIERDGKLPPEVERRAAEHRVIVLNHPQERRKFHERIP